MAVNLADIFFQQAAAQANNPVIFGPADDMQISYAMFQQQIQSLAEQLCAEGILPGMNIALHYPSGQAYIAYTYALWACGASVTPIPQELANDEKLLIFQHIAIDAVISTLHFSAELSAFINVDVVRLNEKAELIRVNLLREKPAELAGLNPAFIRFTSGTTGDAKGVILSHETIYQRIKAANQGLQIGSDDRIVWLLSMAYHFTVSIVAYLSFGASIILCKNSFGITIIQAARRYKATIIYGAPNHYGMMVQDNSGLSLPDLRLAIVTTARLTAELAKAFYQRFGLVLNETYGIIEIGLPAVNLEQNRAKQGSVGKLLPAYGIKLRQASDEGVAEILLNGPGLLDAYYTPWQTREAILLKNQGWLATGDLGIIDDDGFITLIGRCKEMISVGGMKFFPQEVESILERHPAIQEACVFAIKARRIGETPISHLVLAEGCQRPDEIELKDYCAEHLANYKIPSQFQWVGKLTRTASGKLIRNASKLTY